MSDEKRSVRVMEESKRNYEAAEERKRKETPIVISWDQEHFFCEGPASKIRCDSLLGPYAR